jgi:hypothetical protein
MSSDEEETSAAESVRDITHDPNSAFETLLYATGKWKKHDPRPIPQKVIDLDKYGATRGHGVAVKHIQPLEVSKPVAVTRDKATGEVRAVAELSRKRGHVEVSALVGTGGGSGKATMHAVKQHAAKKNKGVQVYSAYGADSFYRSLGMNDLSQTKGTDVYGWSKPNF